MIQTNFNTLYIIEIKFSKNLVNSEIIEEIKQKINHLSMPKHYSYRTVLIHVNGVSETVEEAKYFARIINFSEFFN